MTVHSKYIPDWDKTIIQIGPDNPTNEDMEKAEYVTGWYGELDDQEVLEAVKAEAQKINDHYGHIIK